MVACTWIQNNIYENIDISIKKFKISNLAGSKNINNAFGHLFRQKIHHNQDVFKDFPIIFFRSSAQKPYIKDYGNNPLIPIDLSKKIILFETFQFSIVIENSRQDNYFTEKLIDCLITKTIPIYYGCLNIDDFFDTSGWIILDNDDLNELCDRLKLLSEDYYEKFSDTIEKNYNTAKSYADFYVNLCNAK